MDFFNFATEKTEWEGKRSRNESNIYISPMWRSLESCVDFELCQITEIESMFVHTIFLYEKGQWVARSIGNIFSKMC